MFNRPILTLNPSRLLAIRYRRKAMSALHADSSLSVRLKRYNEAMEKARALESKTASACRFEQSTASGITLGAERFEQPAPNTITADVCRFEQRSTACKVADVCNFGQGALNTKSADVCAFAVDVQGGAQ